eukprot:jgi/Phyca11/18887/fgenesh1_pg.PHYCAscaffold_41_\
MNSRRSSIRLPTICLAGKQPCSERYTLNGALSKTWSLFVHRPTLNGLGSPISKGRSDRRNNMNSRYAVWNRRRLHLLAISRPSDKHGLTQSLIAIVRSEIKPTLKPLRYEDFEETSRQVFWETTHKLPITSAMCAAEPFLEQYRKDCRVRRMRAGPRWKRLLKHLMAGLKSGECGLDLLLDPYFLHFPARGEQVCWYPGQGERQRPADLLAALQIVDRDDPWRNQHRENIADHPGSRLTRLDRKFFQADDSD